MSQNYPSTKEVCRELWVSGKLKVKQRGEELILRKKTYPLFTLLWCLLIMGGVGWAFFALSEPQEFASPFLSLSRYFWTFFAVIAALMVALFWAVAWYANRKPAIAIFNQKTGKLHLPRLGEDLFDPQEIAWKVVPARINTANGRAFSQILFLCVRKTELRPEQEYAFFCEQSLGLWKPASQFAKQAGIELFQGEEIEVSLTGKS